MKKRRFFFILCLLFSTLSFIGCDSDDEKPNPPQLIGLSLSTTSNSYRDAVVSYLSLACKERGYTLIITNAEGKVSNQLVQMDALMNLGIKSIIIDAPKEDISAEIEKLKKTNIPLINILNPLSDPSLADAVIINNNKQAGKAVADVINAALPGGGKYQVLYRTGEVSDNERIQRIEGLTENLNASNLPFSNPLSCVDSLSALSRARSIISRDISVCIALDDVSINALAATLEASDKTLDDMKLIVISGSPGSKKLLKEGKISAVIAQSPAKLASTSMDICIELINNKPVKQMSEIENQTITSDNITNYDINNWE
jgi:ribose transport system substrate-binding protein